MNLNENKLAAEANLQRNVHLINNNMANNSNLINSINPELCLDVDGSSNSENNSSSQPSSKISIQRLFRKRSNAAGTQQCFSFGNLMQKVFSFKKSVQTNRLSNYVNCLNRTESTENADQFTNHQFLNSQLNPIFIDQLDCQNTSIKERAFRQYSSTLKANQISLVRLQNAQRAARLIKASNYFNQYNHFARQQLLTSSMKSDSLLISTRRQLVRDQLIKTIKQDHLINEEQNLIDEIASHHLNETKRKSKNESKDDEEDCKQFYYFAQHCFTLPPKKEIQKNHHLIQQDTFDKSSDISNTSDSDASLNKSENNSKTSNDLTVKSSRSSQFIEERKQRINKKMTTTADVHLKKLNHFNGHKSEKMNLNNLSGKPFDISKPTKLNRLNLKNKDLKSNSDAKSDVDSNNLKYIVIDDTVFAD